MNNRCIIQVLAAVAFVLNVTSCQDYEAVSQPAVVAKTYDGTLLDYLSEGNAGPDIRFDSLLYLIDRLPGLKDSLSSPSGNLTLFVVPDRSFELSLKTLNSYRESYKLGKALSLRDFMIEPFTVTDTVIKYPGTSFADTTYVDRKYDYRGQVDSLVCRYIFSQGISTDSIIALGGDGELESLKYERNMYMTSARGTASGASDLGLKYLNLIETNNSKLQAQWVTAAVSEMDIKATNGWIHVISPRHEFGFNEVLKKFKDYGNEYKKQ